VPRHFDPADLPETVTRFAQAEVAAGRYASVEDVLIAAVEALRQRAEAEQEWLEEARSLWKDRAAAAERGEFSEGTPTEMMARIRVRLQPEPESTDHPTGAALIEAMQASPHRDVDLEPARVRLPAREAEDLS
jgi:Arc/MetJ-type ribon-helix-helix transcriptional regulator